MTKGKVIAIILLACLVALAASFLVFRGDIFKAVVQNNFIPVVQALISSGADVNENYCEKVSRLTSEKELICSNYRQHRS